LTHRVLLRFGWAAACPHDLRLLTSAPTQSTCRHNLLEILTDDAAHDAQFLGQLALQHTLVDVADVTQASDDRQPPQPGAQLPDGIVFGAAATPGDHISPGGRGGPCAIRHFRNLHTLSDTSAE
jgi:hypothetical protein